MFLGVTDMAPQELSEKIMCLGQIPGANEFEGRAAFGCVSSLQDWDFT